MQDHENADPTAPKRVPWNKGKLIGAKPPLRPKHVRSIRPEAVNHGIAAASTNRRLFQRYPPSTDIGTRRYFEARFFWLIRGAWRRIDVTR
jgi:hypothetical protein